MAAGGGGAALCRLGTLRLDRAGIQSFGDAIAALEGLASLTSLSLSGNPIATIGLVEGAAGPGGADVAAKATEESCGGAGGIACAGLLSRLRSLDLSHTLVGDFGSVEQLGKLPALRSLRLSGVPLLGCMEPDIARMLCIARLPNVSAGGAGLQTVGSETCGRFNGAPVSRSDRREAEAFAERWVSGEWRRFREAHGKGDGAGAVADSAQVPRDSTPQHALARLG